MSDFQLGCGSCEFSFPLERVYCCKKCSHVVCPLCVDEELASFYCPQCLAVVASRQALELDNRCRRCASCPLCQAPLQTLQLDDDDTATNNNTDDAKAPRFCLRCPHCRWSSAELRAHSDGTPSSTSPLLCDSVEALQKALLAHSSTAVPWADTVQTALQAERTAAQQAAQQKNAHAKSTYVRGATVTPRKTPRKPSSTAPGTPAPASSAASSGGAPFSLADRYRLDEQRVARDDTAPPAAAPPQSEPIESANLSTVDQRLRDAAMSSKKDCLWPRRMLLETRTVKRCGSCKSLLVKPDLAPDKASFSQMNASAVEILPNIELIRDDDNNAALLFDNETPTAMTVNVSIVNKSEKKPNGTDNDNDGDDDGDDTTPLKQLELGPFDDTEKRRARITIPNSATQQQKQQNQQQQSTTTTTIRCLFSCCDPPIKVDLHI